MAEASLDQGRKAFESFISSAQQTAAAFGGASFGAPGEAAKEISAKAIAFAEKNVQSSLAYAQQLIHAKDLTEVTAVEQVLNDVPALSQLIDGSRFLPRRNGARWIQLDQRPAA